MDVMEHITHIGDPIDFEHETDNFFALTFLPLDFFDDWERGSLLSNFAADYFQHNFRRKEEHNLISTVVNELIENAVKFSRNNSAPVQVILKKRREELLIQADNSVPRHRQESFVTICRDIFNRDLEELYIERIHSNAQNPSASGIGLILIKKDYSSGLGFDFYTDENNISHVAVTTMLDLHELRIQHDYRD